MMTRFLTRSTWTKVDRFAAMLTILFLLVWWSLPVIGSVCGYWFPVVSQVVLSEPKPHPPPSFSHKWGGEGWKYRDCDYLRTEWFLGQPGERAVGIPQFYTGPPILRPTGPMLFEGIVIEAPSAQVLGNSHAFVFHRCSIDPLPNSKWDWHIRFPWETKTLFYDSSHITRIN